VADLVGREDAVFHALLYRLSGFPGVVGAGHEEPGTDEGIVAGFEAGFLFIDGNALFEGVFRVGEKEPVGGQVDYTRGAFFVTLYEATNIFKRFFRSVEAFSGFRAEPGCR